MKIHILLYKKNYSKIFQGFKKKENSPPEILLDDTFHKYLSISFIMQNM